MNQQWCDKECSNCDCMEFWKASKFTLKAIFCNRKSNSLVIYKVDNSLHSDNNLSKFPSGTIIATNLSSKTSFVLQVEKADGSMENMLVSKGSEAAIYVTSIAKVSVYSEKGSLAGGRFYFDLMQPA